METPTHCTLCPRRCGADRTRTHGLCGGGGMVKIARAALHFWEEPCISGTQGSGTVFFSGCPLQCCYCQNHGISAGNFGREISTRRLADIFLELQEQGAHNINLVTAGGYLPRGCGAPGISGRAPFIMPPRHPPGCPCGNLPRESLPGISQPKPSKDASGGTPAA